MLPLDKTNQSIIFTLPTLKDGNILQSLSTLNVNSMPQQRQFIEGYDPLIFLNEVNSDFLCQICNLVVRKPRECIVCGNIFCESCIKNWAEKTSKLLYSHCSPNNRNLNISISQSYMDNLNYIITECPMKCKANSSLKESIVKPVGKVVKNLLYQMEIKCPNKDCGLIFTLDKYEEHETYCFLPKCENAFCKIGTNKLITYKPDNCDDEKRFCKDLCKFSYIFQEHVNSTSNKDELAVWFHRFLKDDIKDLVHHDCEKRILNLKSMVKAVSGNNVIINDNEYSSGITNFKWDNNRKGQGIQVFNNGEGLLLNETCYAFRTIVGNTPFESGVHYWEIIADRRTENELKVGITKNINFNYDTSFSDYNYGYAFYGIGQLRYNNNATGDGYGKKFRKAGVLGVFLDMNRVSLK